ncbi:MAG: hypothetical protein LBT09_13975 [Planctomycetaceae bacterium]|nr:hypothetical protein [Planctomycetaceae bacterium]
MTTLVICVIANHLTIKHRLPIPVFLHTTTQQPAQHTLTNNEIIRDCPVQLFAIIRLTRHANRTALVRVQTIINPEN